ncbi:MAG: heavy metal-responsive transcriptional regulator, partial [Phototrophicales bacterium]
MYSIGDLSQQTGVSSKTIRFYEQIELLPPARRAPNGYRQYDERDVERLQFVRRARALDFAIDEIKEILDFRERNEPPCRYVMDVMQERMIEIEQRIRDLEKLRDELRSLHRAGKQLPEDVQMRDCVCHLIQTGRPD